MNKFNNLVETLHFIPNSVWYLPKITFKMIRWLEQCIWLSLYFDLLSILNVKFFKYLYNSPIIVLDSILWGSQLHKHKNCPAMIPATHFNYLTADKRNLGACTASSSTSSQRDCKLPKWSRVLENYYDTHCQTIKRL